MSSSSSDLPAIAMFVPVAVATSSDRERHQQASRDGDPDEAGKQDREHGTPESGGHIELSLCCSTQGQSGVFAMRAVSGDNGGRSAWARAKALR
jgi:hypothetical protein